MIICKFSGKLVYVETVSTLDFLTRYHVTFEITYLMLRCPQETENQMMGILSWKNVLLPFYCWNIEKRVVRDDVIFSSSPLLREYLNLIISSFTSKRFSSLYKLARSYYLLYEDWNGVILSSEHDETEEELYEIGIAYLSLDKNE